MIVSFVRRLPPIIVALMAATLGVSLYAAIDARGGGDLYAQLALVPLDVWHGEVWRLVTWAIIEGNPVSLIYGCAMIYVFGGDLVEAWGTRRFTIYVIAIVLVASVGTSVVGLIAPSVWDHPHLGGLALGNALLVAWALAYPDRTVRLYAFVELGGPILAYGTVGVTAMFAVFSGLEDVLPELFAGAAALAYARRLPPVPA